ncbi:DeoR/GlpR family DNA-binding transcription regulator [Nocardioidaceae bacterium SCSIO 66511]|nr:DeoR/GlpR family DNA-binding transcription regulator [Nocardioidaceae bacterium SCSIO 66511]
MATEIPAARLERLRELVDRRGVVSLKQAQEALDVSVMTVRRDFAALEELGVVRRTRGGVVGVGRVVPDTSYADRKDREVDAKSTIGRAAAGLVEDGDTIFLSGGTTCLAMARALASTKGVTVVTNSLDALAVLVPMPELTVIGTGGHASGRNNDMTGPVAESMIAGLRATKAFIGASGLTPDGVFNADLGRASIDRVMSEAANETVVLSDHTKIGASAFALVTALSGVDSVVTDKTLRKAEREWLTAEDVSVLVARAGTRLDDAG